MDTINKETNENGINKELNKTSSLGEFYAGSGILVTGATGFVGKGLLEKLIRMCPRIAAIFILIRPTTNLHEIGEKVYTTSLKPSEVIDICDQFDKSSIIEIEKKILKTYPNTYTFSKNLAEQIVASKCKDLPVAIVRPSIVGASLQEPCPGWIENISALTSTIMLIGRGCATAIRGRRDAISDIVPVDFVVDMIICTAWHVTLHRDHEVKVYNCTSNACPFKWGQMRDAIVKCSTETPLNDTLWYPGCPMIANRYIYQVRSIIPHVLPAFVIDIFLRLRGSKPIMMKLLLNGNKLFTMIAYFIMHEWTFQRDNCSDLVRIMHEWTFQRDNCSDLVRKVKILNDGDMVKLDLRAMNWEKYVAIYLMGIRKFIQKQEFKSAARQWLSRLYWIHQITKMSGIMILLWIVYCIVY
ncbi:LOW QUALITY PROTEIN: fatty acyl-CoA reductase 1-like [Bombus impatiens]|uniref:Fatty acyl-CoA reductase n=1 Tax=Bombus impatiens TaxID=132113 RepID=A0A6P8M112_BOMIM|nr:LOW QUALITY PROTEIN: fatty acyl-CoA reductase 1-like [Bombus impatiens]